MRFFGRVLLATVVVGIGTPLFSEPPSASAESGFGGYSASAETAVIRMAVYEPALPIPTVPQLDFSLGYARSTTSTGPVARALATYFWPGDTLGDGLGTLFANEALDYPIKVNSKYPASDTAPAKNSAQITDGNGMVTSADGTDTKAEVTGLTVGGNLISGIGTGLCGLLKQKCPAASEVGVPLPTPIATLASYDVSKSQSTVHLGDTVVSNARVRATGLSILGGLITVDGVDMQAKATSDGKVGTTDGSLTITGLNVAGKKVALEDAVDIDSPNPDVPKSPLDLSAIGIKVDYLNRAKTVEGASGKLAADGLTITVDVGVLGKQLKLGALSDVLGPYLDQIPQLGPLLTGLLKFGSKFVITVGDVRVAATATPAYVSPGSVPGGPTTDPNPAPSVGVFTPTGPADVGGPTTEPGIDPVLTPPALTNAPFRFPGLGQTPSLLLLGALALVGLIGWLFKGFGAFFLAADDCELGASVGVPNLREG